MSDFAFSANHAQFPHPETHPEFYEDVVSKRLLAWLVDVLIISILTAILSIFTLFTALFFWPLFYAVISFLYRWTTLIGSSATLGMRLFAIEFRRNDGSKFDSSTALLHTAGYFASVAIFPAQLVSIAMMLISPRRQGLSDSILGTALLNTRIR
ncbi:MAG: RDD family protein [Boseongicola sp.]